MEEKNFVAYEYKTKTVKAENGPAAADMYEAMGWEIVSSALTPAGGLTLSLKRDRKIRHRQELVKAERQAEEAFETLLGLKRSVTFGAAVFAYIFGVAAALLFGGGMSLVMTMPNSVPALIGGIVMGVAGLVLCGVNYFIYKKSVQSKRAKVQPAIEQGEENFYNLLERANGLLSAEII